MTKTQEIGEQLKSAIREGRIANTYVIIGGDAATRKRLATEAAAEMISSKADLVFPIHEKENLFSVTDVREEIVKTLYVKPYGTGKKVYVVADADLMNVQAQNALLKSLEEPPKFTVFFLLSETGATLLPTVLSRAVKITLPKDGDTVTEEQKEALTREKNLLIKCEKITPRELSEYVAYVKSGKRDTNLIFEYMRCWFRDVAALKITGQCDKEESLVKKEQAKNYSYEELNRIQEFIHTAESRVAANVSAEQTFFVLFESIKRVRSNRK